VAERTAAALAAAHWAGAFFHTFFRVYSPVEFPKKYDKVPLVLQQSVATVG
jgi:hypothetical protein